jgi:signal transduction histidine kinase
VSVASFGLLAIGMSLSPTATTLQFFGILLTFAVIAAINVSRDLVIAWVVGAASLAYSTLVLPTGLGWPDFLLTLAFCSIMTVATWLVRRHAHQVDAVRAQATQDLLVQHERSREALSEERARLARELHDVVSHGLSVVVLQTQAARLAVDDLPGVDTREAERHLGAVEATARDALGEMRRMLGLLQLDAGDTTEAAPAPPTPGLADLPYLLERATTAGLVVDAELPLGSTSLPAGLGLNVYRIVQESLTNIVKHAPGARVTVRVELREAAVDITVENTGGAPAAIRVEGARHGLIGMRERVEMYGGRLDAEVTGPAGFRVHAVLPHADAHASVQEAPVTS